MLCAVAVPSCDVGGEEEAERLSTSYAPFEA